MVVIITSDDDTVPGDIYEGGGQSKVLVPKLREKKIILDLEYPLNPHSHYSISLSFPSQHTLFMNFCELAIFLANPRMHLPCYLLIDTLKLYYCREIYCHN